MVSPTVILGAGPAGLTAAYELAKNNRKCLLLEPSDQVGGLFHTEAYQGYRFQLGRYLAAEPCRIYYRDRLFDYPLSLTNALKHFGPIDTALSTFSSLKARTAASLLPALDPSLVPYPQTLESWLIECLGEHLYRIFFEPYIAKIWGISGSDLQASRPSLRWPFGPHPSDGQLSWKQYSSIAESMTSAVQKNTQVLRIKHSNYQVSRIFVQQEDGITAIASKHFISTLPLSELIQRLDPAPPSAILQAANSLSHRSLITVPIIVNIQSLSSDCELYIQSPKYKVSHLQNYKNDPQSINEGIEPNKTCLGMTYFCDPGDPLWATADTDLVHLAKQELMDLGFVTDGALIEQGTVIRQANAYPIQHISGVKALALVQDYLERFGNLQTVGRAGLHTNYGLTHAMLTGSLAAKNILGEQHNLWALRASALADKPLEQALEQALEQLLGQAIGNNLSPASLSASANR